MKKNRQSKILELIEKYDIGTQEALMQKLSEEGFETTQTTLSRDIRQMKLVKSTTGKGSYKYVPSADTTVTQVPGIGSAMTESIRKMQVAGNMLVIRTLSGMANAIAVCVDNLGISDIIGSVAGDDTILIVLADHETAISVLTKMKESFAFKG